MESKICDNLDFDTVMQELPIIIDIPWIIQSETYNDKQKCIILCINTIDLGLLDYIDVTRLVKRMTGTVVAVKIFMNTKTEHSLWDSSTYHAY